MTFMTTKNLKVVVVDILTCVPLVQRPLLLLKVKGTISPLISLALNFSYNTN